MNTSFQPFDFLGEFVVQRSSSVQLAFQGAHLGLFGVQLLGQPVPAGRGALCLLPDALELSLQALALSADLLILKRKEEENLRIQGKSF